MKKAENHIFINYFKSFQRIFAATILFLCGGFLFAFGERHVDEFALKNGIPVYVVENKNNQIDSVCIGVKGGISYFTEEQSGIENAVFKMMLNGSASYSKVDFQNVIYSTNSRFRAASLREGSVLSLVSMEEYLEETLPMLLDGFMNPVFERKEYETLFNEYYAQIQSMLNDPSSLAFYYGKKILYSETPYSISPSVGPESIGNLSLEELVYFHKSLMNSKRIFVVAVTSMDSNKLVSVLNDYLGSIPAGEDVKDFPSDFEFDFNQKPVVFSHASAVGTGFVVRAYDVPGFKSEAFIPEIVAEHIYSQIMHNVVRAKYGACYSAEATNFSDVANVGCEYLYRVSDFTDLKKRMAEARDIIARGEYVSGTNKDGSFVYRKITDDFENFVNSVKNSMYSSLATTASTASTLCTSLLVWGDLTSLDEQRNRINSVTYKDVQKVFEQSANAEGGFWLAVTGPENEALVEELLNRN